MIIRSLHSEAEIENAFNILRELRTDLSWERFRSVYDEARRRDGYELVGMFKEDRCVAVMGYRVLFDFVHGKHLYVDDLVVTAQERSRGVGAELLRYADRVGEDLGCSLLRLSTGVQNEGARRFYEREGWVIKSVTYKKTPTTSRPAIA